MTQRASLDPPALRSLAAAEDQDPAGLRSLDADTLMGGAASVLALARRRALQVQRLRPRGERRPTDAGVELVRVLARHETHDVGAVASVCSWWLQAYGLAATSTIADGDLPPTLSRALRGLHEGGRPAAIDQLVEAALSGALAELEREAKTYRQRWDATVWSQVCGERIALLRGAVDGGLPVDDALARAPIDALLERVPRRYEGRARGALLALRPWAAQVVDLNARRPDHVPSRVPIPGDVPSPLRDLLMVALVDVSPDVCEPSREQLATLLKDALQADGDDQHSSVAVARLAEGLSVDDMLVDDALTPLEDIARDLDERRALHADDEQIALLHAEGIAACRSRRRLGEAREWLEWLDTEVKRLNHRRSLDELARGLSDAVASMGEEASDAPQLIAEARARLDEGDLAGAEDLLSRAAVTSRLARFIPDEAPDGEAVASRADDAMAKLTAYEQRGSLEEARSFVDELERSDLDRGVHHLVVARIALSLDEDDVARAALGRARDRGAAAETVSELLGRLDADRLAAAHSEQDPAPLEGTAVDLAGADDPQACLDQLVEDQGLPEVLTAIQALAHHDAELALRLLESLAQPKRVPRSVLPAVWHRQVDVLEAVGRADDARELAAKTRPPVPAAGTPPAEPFACADVLVPWVPQTRPSRRHASLRTASDAVRTGDYEKGALAFEEAVAEGHVVGLAAAIGCWTRAGNAARGIDTYRRTPRSFFAGAATCWNLATALAVVGHRAETLACLRLWSRIVQVATPEQRVAIADVFAEAGEQPPKLAGTPSAQGNPQALLALGRVDEAIAELELLLRFRPAAGEGLLLLRIYREQGRLADAQRLVRALKRRGQRTPQLDVELARVALACSQPDEAALLLDQAREAGAPQSWLSPLYTEVQVQRNGDSLGATLTQESAGVPQAVTDAHRNLLDAGTWRVYVRTELRAGGDRVTRLLELARRLEPVARWAIVDLVNSAVREAPVPADPSDRRVLIDLASRCGDHRAVRHLATALTKLRLYDDALELLQEGEGTIPAQLLPRLWHQQLPLLKRCAPDQVPAFRDRTEPRIPPAPLVPGGEPIPLQPFRSRIEARPGTDERLLMLQVRSERNPDDAMTDEWVAHARKRIGLALPQAVGGLVEDGRPAAALELWRELAGSLYPTSQTIWNIACAYAALGLADHAAHALGIHARVFSGTLDGQRDRERRAVFAAASEPVPRGPASEPKLERAFSHQSEQPTPKRFTELCAALRDARRRGSLTPAQVARRAEIEHSRLTRARPETVAELAQILDDAGRGQEAWQALSAELEAAQPGRRVIEGATRLARTVEQQDELERILATCLQEGAVPMARARLARGRVSRARAAGGALAASVHLAEQRAHAARAVDLDPSDPEAARLASERLLDQLLAQVNARLDDVVGREVPQRESVVEAVEALTSRLGDVLSDELRDHVEEADPSRSFEAPAWNDHADAVCAARAGDWELALSLFQSSLRQHPRNERIAANAAIAALRAGMPQQAARLIRQMWLTALGARALAVIALAQADIPSALKHVLQLQSRRPHDDGLFVLEAALRAGGGDRADAARRLLDVAQQTPPADRRVLAALALALASDETVAAAAFDRVLEPRLDAAGRVAWACAAPGRLRTLRVGVTLNAELTAILLEAAPDAHELRELLQWRAYRRADGHAALALATLEAGAGRELHTIEALACAHDDEATRDAATQRLETLLEHGPERLRARVRAHLDGHAQPAPGAPAVAAELDEPTARMRRALEGAVPSVDDADAEVIGIVARLTSAAPIDGPILPLLERLWREELALNHQASRELDDDVWRRASDTRMDARMWADRLLTPQARAGARTVSEVLMTWWERIGAANRALRLFQPEELRAWRLGDGPTEVLLRFRASGDLRSARLSAADHGAAVAHGAIAAGELVTIALSLDDHDGDRVALSLSLTTDGDRVEERLDVDVKPREPVNASRFESAREASSDILRGRESLVQTLLAAYDSGAARVDVHALHGPHRIGKSSVVRELSERLEARNESIVVVRVQSGLRVGDEFAGWIELELYKRARKLKAAGRLRCEPPRPQHLGIDLWLEMLAEQGSALRWVVVLDEFEKTLDTLRAQQDLTRSCDLIYHLSSQVEQPISFLLATSLPLNRLERELQSSNLRRLTPLPVGFLEDRDAMEVFERGFVAPAQVLREATEEAARLTGGYPHHLHLLGEHIVQQLRDESRCLVGPEGVTRAAQAIEVRDDIAANLLPGVSQDDPRLEQLAALRRALGGELDPRPRGELKELLIGAGHFGGDDEEAEAAIDEWIKTGLLRAIDAVRLTWANVLLWRYIGRWEERMQARAPQTPHDGLAPAVVGELRRRGLAIKPWTPGDPTHDNVLVCHQPDRPSVQFKLKHLEAKNPDPGEAAQAQLVLDALKSAHDHDGTIPGWRGRLDAGSEPPIMGWHLFDYVPGDVTLAQRISAVSISDEGALVYGVRDVVRWVSSVARCLHYAWVEHRLAHGDIKPQNIVLRPSGTATLIDWENGSIGGRRTCWSCGTHGYMSPAWARANAGFDAGDRGAEPADDIFALSITAYQALARSLQRFPYDQTANADQAGAREPDKPDACPPELWDVLRRGMSLRQEDRFASLEEFEAALEQSDR